MIFPSLILVSLLALASPKPFFPMIQNNPGFPTSYSPFFASRFHSDVDRNTVQLVPVINDVNGGLDTPAIIPVSSVAPELNPDVQDFADPFSRYYDYGDDLTNTFAYSEEPFYLTETRGQFGNVQGAFNYIVPLENIQIPQYVTDLQGLREIGTNPSLDPIINLDSSRPVQETVEVKAARKTFEGKHRTKRQAEVDTFSVTDSGVVDSPPQNTLPTTDSDTSEEFSFSEADVDIENPEPKFIFKPGTLLKITHNPGHAISYREYAYK